MNRVTIDQIEISKEIPFRTNKRDYARARRESNSGVYSARTLLLLQQRVRGFRAETVDPELFAPDIAHREFLEGLAEQPNDVKLRMLVATFLDAISPDTLASFIAE